MPQQKHLKYEILTIATGTVRFSSESVCISNRKNPWETNHRYEKREILEHNLA